MGRLVGLAGVLLVVGCGKEAAPAVVAPESSGAPALGSVEGEEQDAARAEPGPEPAALDVPALAAGEAIVFLRAGERCEAWQFVDGGARLERTDDESLGLVLSFAVGVRGSDALTLTDPRATSRGEAVALQCPEGEAREDLLFSEEADCETRQRSATVKAGCPDTLLSEDQRGAALHRLEAERAAIVAARVDAAPGLLELFRRALRRHKAVFWRNDDGTCDRWSVVKDTLVRKTEGGRTEYGFATSIDRRTGLARVDLTGPGFVGKDGSSMGMGDFQQLPLNDVSDSHATVGPNRWYFTQAACEKR